MIHINLLRISTDSQYLEFSVECNVDYIFNQLYITRYNVLTKNDDPPKDASSILSGTTNQEIIRISTAALGIGNEANVSMYKVEFGVIRIGSLIDPQNPEIDNVIGICSNINFVYANMLDLVMNLTNCCISQSEYETLSRNHMILYAHQEAMRLERYSEAKYFYDIIWKLFTNCGVTPRQQNITNNPCNCTN